MFGGIGAVDASKVHWALFGVRLIKDERVVQIKCRNVNEVSRQRAKMQHKVTLISMNRWVRRGLIPVKATNRMHDMWEV